MEYAGEAEESAASEYEWGFVERKRGGEAGDEPWGEGEWEGGEGQEEELEFEEAV
jgi:hypothetical protein